MHYHAADHYLAKLCSEISVMRKYDLLYEKPSFTDHDYCDVPNIITLSSYKEAAVAYMAEYVVHIVKARINCLECKEALSDKEGNIHMFSY